MPGQAPNVKELPQSYSVRDIARPGFPHLTRVEATLVERVAYYVKSKTLRISWIRSATTNKRFIIFDAIYGPCGGNGYVVLNGECNEIYEPTDIPFHTVPVPNCFAIKRPWLSKATRYRR